MGHDWLGGLGTATGVDPANAAGADDADPDLADADPDLDPAAGAGADDAAADADADPAAGAGADDAAADADLDPDPDAAAIRRCPSSTRRAVFARRSPWTYARCSRAGL